MTALPRMTALIYTDSEAADEALRGLARVLMKRDFRLAGLVQHNHHRPQRSRCDMVLEELGSGHLIPISQDRGQHARGCRLDLGQLLSAIQLIRAQLATGPDLVILNKFGKTEAEGGGFRELIAEVVEAGIPLVIAVPWRNIESWRLFLGESGHELILEDLGKLDWEDILQIQATSGTAASSANEGPNDGSIDAEQRSTSAQTR